MTPAEIKVQQTYRTIGGRLVHAQHARHGGDVPVQPLVGVFLKDAAHHGLLDPVHVGGVSESPVDGVDGKLVAEPDRHVSVGINARQGLQLDLAAPLTPPALALDPQGHGLPLDGEVLEANGPQAVLSDLGHGRARARLNPSGRHQINIHNEAVTSLLGANGLEAVEPQQIVVGQVVTPTHLKWRNLRRAYLTFRSRRFSSRSTASRKNSARGSFASRDASTRSSVPAGSLMIVCSSLICFLPMPVTIGDYIYGVNPSKYLITSIDLGPISDNIYSVEPRSPI